MHVPVERRTSSETIVLLVHGIQGSPAQFKWLIEKLPDSVDYLCPLLPGHGKTVNEFSAVGEKEWLRFMYDLVRDLSSRYRRIIYVGHSMGCLLGLLSAASGSFTPDGMLLLACPLALRPTFRYFLNNYRSVIQSNPTDPWLQSAKDANSVYARHPIAYIRCIKPYLGLLKLMCMSRKALKNLNAPVIAVHSKNDEIVSRHSLALLRENCHAETVIANGSGHFFYSDESRKMIAAKLLSIVNART